MSQSDTQSRIEVHRQGSEEQARGEGGERGAGIEDDFEDAPLHDTPEEEEYYRAKMHGLNTIPAAVPISTGTGRGMMADIYGSGGGGLLNKYLGRDEYEEDVMAREVDLQVEQEEEALGMGGTYLEEEEITTNATTTSEGRAGGTTIVHYAIWEQTTFHLPAWLVSMLAYLLLPGGAIVALTERKSFYTSFHGFQSFMINVAWLPFLVAALLGDLLIYNEYGFICFSFAWLGILVLISLMCAIVAAWRAPDGSPFSLPLVGPVALMLADKTFSDSF